MINHEDVSLDGQPCSTLKGVGPKTLNYLQRLGIGTVQDLLFHLPLRYEDRTQAKPLNRLVSGDHVQVKGEIIHAEIKEGRRKSLLVRIEDGNGFLLLRFFHFNTFQVKQLSTIGQRLHCYGEVRWGMTCYEMIHPEYSFLKEGEPIPIKNTLTPVYPTTEGLHQYHLRKLIDQALMLLSSGRLIEYLPQTLLKEFDLPDLISAVQYIHSPPAHAPLDLLQKGLHPTQQRLVFEELLAHQLCLTRIRVRTKNLTAHSIIDTKNVLIDRFRKQLPFQLTQAQEKVIQEIVSDLQSGKPMLRLVQGDVGSGKTCVAAMAALYVIASGFQVAIMAPTELLAEQHFRTFSLWFQKLAVEVAWLTSSIKGKAREQVCNKIAASQVQMIVGTHALFQKDITFGNLGLIIIDEQHRFGVHQRLALLNKGIWLNTHPHQLIMSATPIPRTLAMTAYADLDCSTIDELPPGRTPVKTIVLPNSKREELINRIRENCLAGAQVYWVCTLIQESEVLQCQAAEEITQELISILPQLRIGMVHGRMKAKEKEQTMLAFKNQEINLLVATTVIEVGVDVPNASLMVIENSERLGLAQLHQLRGRVGRGSVASHCVLMYQEPLSLLAKERLGVLRNHNDGFVIAQKDLELRGPGELLGTRQTGLIQFRIADLSRDQDQLTNIQKAAEMLLNQSPQHVDPLIQRWLAGANQFSEV